MLDLKGTPLESLPVVDLEWSRDLLYFDGPLISVFRHRRHGDSYLYYWCDSDENVNRWMLLRVSETDLIRLVNRLIPVDHLIPKGCQDDFVYIVDMDNDCKQRAIRIVSINAVPEMYSPVQGTFLPEEVTQEIGSYWTLPGRAFGR